MPSSDLVLVALAVALLVLTMLLAAAETALERLSKPKAQALAEERRRGARRLAELLARPEPTRATVRIGLLVCQAGEAALVTAVGYRLLDLTGVLVATLANVALLVCLTELVARRWAIGHAEAAGLATAPLVGALTPLARVVHGTTDPARGRGTDEGVIEQSERQLIDSIIDFGDTVVREVMVPRPDMVTVEAEFRVADVMEVMLLTGYSRLPACGEGIDDVVGLVYAKDLMRAERDGNEHRPVSELLRHAGFVPETKRLPELLREMQQQQFHMAIVLDEYGGTAGLVTLEDIIEELVGEIVDEYDVEDPMIEPLPGGDTLVRGRTPLDEVNDLLDTSLPEGDWDTVGGLVYSRLGHVPSEGESVVINGWRLTAQRIQGRRIGRVRISPPPRTTNGTDPSNP